MDLLFIVTGQACSVDTCSSGSIVFNALINLSSFNFTVFFKELIGDVLNLAGSGAGIASLVAGVSVTLGTVLTKSDSVLFIPVALTFGIIGADFIVIYALLSSINTIAATLIMGPIMVLYAVTVVDWVRGKD